MKKAEASKFLYLFRAGENHYKVGIASHVLKRLATIQTGSPRKVDIITAVYIPGALAAEQEIHRWLHEHQTDSGGEWFELSDRQAVDLVAKISMYVLSADIVHYLQMRDLIARQTEVEERAKKHVEEVRLALEDMRKKLESTPYREPDPEALATVFENAGSEHDGDLDPLFDMAVGLVTALGRASTSMLQRRLMIGYARAARLIDQLEERGVVGAQDGARARVVHAYKPKAPLSE